ncbi:MAG: YcfL family protein [Verrucomicrobiota bacterium]|nr:YcfL family protein [Verrucomicrobiota bacterium]
MKLRLPIITLLALIFGVTGCYNTGHTDPRVMFIDRGISTHINIADVSSSVNSGSLLEVQVVGYSKSSKYRRFQYKVDWFDETNRLVKSTHDHWRDVSADQKSEFYINAIGPNPNARSFKLKIRKK